jgi:CRP-like cAMP-binding protein
MVGLNQQKVELLRRVDLFSDLPQGSLEVLADVAVEIEFPQGHYIVQQGMVGSGLFVIVSGSVKVVRGDDVLATLGPGDFFGELSVLDQSPRSASVIALQPTVCLGIASWELLRVLEEQPKLALALLRALAARLRAADERPRH